MVDEQFPESSEERKSRELLLRFLRVTDRVLDRILMRIIEGTKTLEVVASQLRLIWDSARNSLVGVLRTIEIGLSQARRRALKQIGMFAESLFAKFALLEIDIKAGALKRVLKRLNSMLSSLAKVFPALHAVKEFKDHVEATIDGVNDALEFITLRDLLDES